MKNEPTHLEIFQRERIKALEEEVARLKAIAEPERKVSVIDINDPIFDRPLAKKYEFGPVKYAYT